MLKGQVFSKQIFENQIFALFINTFLEGQNGISNNYKNGMALSYSGNNVTIQSGAVCIQGRFLEEDLTTTVSAGTDTAFCKLIIEIDLDETNTESSFLQGSYKIIKGLNDYPNLTQTNIVKNNAGIYQYELARFKNSSSGISEFQDKRTFLDFSSIYTAIQTEYRAVLAQLEEELENVEDGSAYLLKTGGTAGGDFIFNGAITASNISNSNGSKVIYRDDFAIITGNMNLNGNLQENLQMTPIKCLKTNTSINYPTGFNKDNCVLLNISFKRYNDDTHYFSNGWDNYPNSSDSVRQTLPYDIKLGATIDLSVGNMSTNVSTCYYKIVLMKIS